MLAVVVSPHGFTTALASEASIVPRASHREITLAACLGRVLGAEPQVRCRCMRLPQLFIQLRVALPPPNRTCAFPSHPALQLPASSWGGDTHYASHPRASRYSLPPFAMYRLTCSPALTTIAGPSPCASWRLCGPAFDSI